MQSYTLTIKSKEDVAKGTVAFKLEKPEGFTFKPGQYMQVILSDDKSDSHTFSIASAPHEEFLMFTTRVREESTFKARLVERGAGDSIIIEAPGGQFTLPKEDDVSVVFLVGGIGITPIRSMLKHEEHGGSTRPTALFYSNRTPEEAAFLHELENLKLKNYHFIPTMTNMSDSAEEWNGETGYITAEMVEKYIDDVTAPMFYVVGPPGFVEGMISLLDSMENVPSTHVKSEDFAGY